MLWPHCGLFYSEPLYNFIASSIIAPCVFPVVLLSSAIISIASIDNLKINNQVQNRSGDPRRATPHPPTGFLHEIFFSWILLQSKA